MEDLIINLYDKGCIKTGQFQLKNGSISPMYIDLKNIISYPFIVNKITQLIWEKIKNLEFDHFCGIPYGGIPLSSVLSCNYNKSMLMLRKEVKKYGTNKIIEGTYRPNDKCVLIEDVITTGSSLASSIKTLKKLELDVAHIFVICDRRSHQAKNFYLTQYNLTSLFSIYDVMRILLKNNKINYDIYNNIIDYVDKYKTQYLSFNQRKELTSNTLTKKIFTLMENKKTNLCLSADLRNKNDILDLVSKIGEHICVLKLHCDIIEDFDEDFVQKLIKLAESKQFFIFEDRKFCDIGNTFLEQYCFGVHKINSWAQLITVNCLSGDGIIKSFSKINKYKKKGLLLIHDMSTQNLINEDYKNNVMEYTQRYRKDIVGLITQNRNDGDDSILYFTPGINYDIQNDKKDQNYRDPEQAILKDNCDIIIVGRGILKADDPKKTAEIYKFLGWNAYQKKIQKII